LKKLWKQTLIISFKQNVNKKWNFKVEICVMFEQSINQIICTVICNHNKWDSLVVRVFAFIFVIQGFKPHQKCGCGQLMLVCWLNIPLK